LAGVWGIKMASSTSDFVFHFFARNFRGFAQIEADLGDVTFIVGDNSSGKTSIITLIDLLLSPSFGLGFDIFASDGGLKTSHDVLSPYIRSRNVTIGVMFSESNKKNSFRTSLRIATYKKGASTDLILHKVVSASNNKTRYVIKERDRFVIKDRELSATKPNFQAVLKEHDHPSQSYSTVRVPGFKSAPTALMFALADYNQKDKIFRLTFSSQQISLHHRRFGPIRMDPEHAYNVLNSSFDEKGRHTPSLLKQLFNDRSGRQKNLSHIRAINKFGAESGMFDRLFVYSYKPSDPNAPFRIEVEKKGKRFSLDEVGYGVSQVLPVIVEAVTSLGRTPTLLSIQQPELHLHPKAQAAFGELIFDLSRRNLKFLVETHSDYIINRYRYCLNRSKSDALDTRIFFCENTERGNVLRIINLDSKGVIVDAPPNYRKFFLKEEGKIFEMI
jgi:predicted ATPase